MTAVMLANTRTGDVGGRDYGCGYDHRRDYDMDQDRDRDCRGGDYDRGRYDDQERRY